jgi:YD repeat-containing protein
VSYTYDGSGNLSTVTDPEGGVTTYTYDGSHRMLTITDGRDITYLTNAYTNGRVTTQTLADEEATYELSYTVDGSGHVTQTDVTDPRGHVRRLAFNAGHYVTSDTDAYGTGLARTTTVERASGSLQRLSPDSPSPSCSQALIFRLRYGSLEEQRVDDLGHQRVEHRGRGYQLPALGSGAGQFRLECLSIFAFEDLVFPFLAHGGLLTSRSWISRSNADARGKERPTTIRQQYDRWNATAEFRSTAV